MKSFTTLKNLYKSLSQNNTAANETLGAQLINDAQRYLIQKYFYNETTFTTVTVANQQAYLLPPNYSKLKDVTVNVGTIKYTPIEVLTRQDWDQLNFITYTSDIPAYFFIYNGYLNIYPSPSSNGNTITFNYKMSFADMSIEDYSTGTITSAASTLVTGATTAWTTPFFAAASTLYQNLYLRVTPPSGDGQWYLINNFSTATTLITQKSVQYTPLASGASYVIGQMPLLQEDFHDLLVYRPLMIYYASINPDAARHGEFKGLYEDGIKMLENYAGGKTISIDLSAQPAMINPNLFYIS